MRDMPDAIILCGGSGTRLRSVTGELPKSMAFVAGRPFLELLFDQLIQNGLKRVVLAVGYGRDLIRSHFTHQSLPLDISYSEELSPLGTGGALRNAVGHLRSETALVMNGDSYTDASLTSLVREHETSGADASILVVNADGRDDCGFIRLDDQQRIRSFEEKSVVSQSKYLNAGIYVMSRDLLATIQPQTQLSLERDVFPSWLDAGRVIHASIFAGNCVDIGTPERYRSAQQLLSGVAT